MRDEVVAVVAAYLERYPDERERLAELSAALAAGGDVVTRGGLPGHVTASGVVCDPGGRMLHVWHRGFGRWQQPGGHLEPGDATLAEAARREVVEETGIAAGSLALVDPVPLDIAVHAIPANPAKGEGPHLHFDLRYGFTCPADPPTRPQADEVDAVAWLGVDEMAPEFRRKLHPAPAP